MAYPEGDKVKSTYDARGNVTETRWISKTAGTPADIVTTAGFDATCASPAKCNKPNWTQDARGNQTDYTYDSATGQPLTVTLPAPAPGGARPTTTYAYANQYAWYKNAGGAVVQAPTPISKLATASTCLTAASCAGTANEQKTTIAYQAGSSGAASNLLPVSTDVRAGNNAVSATTAMAYNNVGDLISVDGPLPGSGDTTAYKYDALRRQVGAIGPDPDGGGGLPNQATRTTYDAKGRAWRTEQGTTAGQSDAAWNGFNSVSRVERTFDDADRKLTDRVLSGSATYALTQYGYDARGRLDCATVRMNPAGYGALPGACALGPQGSDGPDRITKYTYNVADEVTLVQSGLGTAALSNEAMAYTNNGKLAAVVDGENNRTTYDYDGHDRLWRTRYPVATKGANASSTTDYQELAYDAASNVIAVRLRDGSWTAMTFDNLNRLTSRTPAGEPTTHVSYNLLNMPTVINRPAEGLSISYAYNALGRVIAEGQPFGSTSYQYDNAGNRTVLAWGDGQHVVYDYDNASRVTRIRENGATTGIGVLATYSYDSLGRRSGVTYGNGTSRGYAYDAVDRLAGLQLDVAGTANDLAIGGIGYNPASQITSLTKSNDAYAYTGRANVNRGYTANGLNQYTAAGPTSLGYGPRGNLTSSGSDTYTYDKLNQLRAGPGVSFDYDGLGRVVQYTAGAPTRMYYAGSALVAEVNTSGAILKRYVPGPGTDEIVVWYEGAGMADRRWLQADERGSIIAVSDASGHAIGINRYDEYGFPLASNIGRFGYTGQTWFREAGLYNFKARFYSFSLGRFMQTDPIGYADGLNWYNYVGGDPINKVDPSGTKDVKWEASDPLIVVRGQRNLLNLTWKEYRLTGSMSMNDFMPAWQRHLTERGDIVVQATKPQSGHYYDTTEQICRAPLSQGQRGQINRAIALPDGTINPSRTAGTYPVGGWLFGIIPTIGGYVTTRFSADGNIAVNTTTSAHLFVGTITRTIYSNNNGTFIRTVGSGDAGSGVVGRTRDELNGAMGPGIFRDANGLARTYAKEINPSC